jgi:hypothetical protein
LKIPKYKRPAKSTLEALLVSQGKEVTGDNLADAEASYKKMRDEGLSSADILKMVKPKSAKKRGVKIPAFSAAEESSDEGSVMSKTKIKPRAKSAAKSSLASVGAAFFNATLPAPAAAVAKEAGKVGLDTFFS